MLQSYVPLVLIFGLAAAFVAFSVALGSLVGPRRYNKAKLDAYECGIEPSPQPVVGGGRTPVKFYMVGMLFILFDVEVVVLYPYAIAADQLGLFGLVAALVFLVIATLPFVYEWRRGGLDWN